MTLKPRHHEATESNAGIERSRRNHVPNIQRDTRRNSAEALTTDLSSLPQIDETGEVRIGRTMAIGLSKYAIANGLTVGTLMKFVEEAGIQPVGNARNGNRMFPAYPKSEVERLPYIRLPSIDDETGEVTIRGKVCVGIYQFIVRNELAYWTLGEAIRKAGLQPFGQAMSRGGKVTDVFLKDKIEALPYVQTAKEVTESLNEKGDVLIKGQLCVSVKSYSSQRNMSPGRLKDAVDAAGLKPFGRARIYGMRTCVDVYLKSDIQKLPFARNNKKRSGLPVPNKEGVVDMGEEIGIVVNRYGKSQGFEVSRFQEAIDKEGLEVIGQAKGKWKTLNVYRLSEVQKLPYVRNVQKGRGAEDIDDIGEIMVGDVCCISVSKWARVQGLHPGHLQEAIDEAKLKPKGKARNYSRVFAVYAKSEVEQLSYVTERIDALPLVPQNGEVTIKRIRGIVISKYAAVLGMSYTPLQKAVREAGLEAVGRASAGGKRIVNVFPKKQVDALPIVKEYLASDGKLGDNGEITIKGKVCISIAKYAAMIKRGHKEIMEGVLAAKLRPMGKAMSTNRIVDVYEKAAIDALPYLKDATRALNEHGEVTIDGVDCIGIAKFILTKGLNFTPFKKEIIEHGLKPVGTARSGTVMVDVYAKRDILRLPYVVKNLGESLTDDPEMIREQLLQEAKRLKIPLDELLDPEKVREHIRRSPILHSLLKALAESEDEA